MSSCSVNYFLEPITYCSYVNVENDNECDGINNSPRQIYTTEPRFIMMLHPNYFDERVITFFDNHSKFVTKWFNDDKYDFFYYVFERKINGNNVDIVSSKQSFIDLCKKAFDMHLFKNNKKREILIKKYISQTDNYNYNNNYY